MIHTHRITKIAALLTLVLATTFTAQAGDLKAKSAEAMQNFKSADPGLSKFFQESAGYAILPSVGEAGLVFGGERGDGLVYKNGKVIGSVTMDELSLGAEAGAGRFSEIIFFENDATLKAFKESKFVMSGEAKATVAASGVAENARYAQGVLVFTLPKGGAMVAADLGGQKFKFKPME